MSNAEHSPKHYTPDEKVSILRRHLIDGVAVSTLCDEHHLRPTAFYRWLKQFFENGAAARPSAPESFPFAMPRLHSQRPKPAQKDRFDGRRPKGIALGVHV